MSVWIENLTNIVKETRSEFSCRGFFNPAPSTFHVKFTATSIISISVQSIYDIHVSVF